MHTTTTSKQGKEPIYIFLKKMQVVEHFQFRFSDTGMLTGPPLFWAEVHASQHF